MVYGSCVASVTACPIPDALPLTSPSSPPRPGVCLIPDFGSAWAAAKARTKTLVSGRTVEHKVDVAAGIGSVLNRCAWMEINDALAGRVCCA